MSDLSCQNLSRYLSIQRDHLRRAIDENKWYLSERQGHDVGLAAAKHDFLEHHLDHVTHDFRMRFCRSACEKRTGCALVDAVHRIPSLRQRG